MPSVVNQVEMALLKIYRPGTKKHEVHQKEWGDYIFAGRSLEVYMEWCCRWATWAKKEFGMRRLVDAELMGQLWVQGLIDTGRSPWTISAVISALRKLERGIRARWGVAVLLIAPEHLVHRRLRNLDQRKRRGAYSASDLAALRQHLPHDDYREALDACVALGLRRREVVSLQAGDVDLTARTFAVKQRDGEWSHQDIPPGYVGVVNVRRGKGGRPRQTPVPIWYQGALSDLMAGAPGKHTRLYPVTAAEFGSAIWEACQAAGVPSGGVHGLRHFWALQQYWHLRSLGHDDEGARQRASWWLGHNRIQVTVNYIPRKAPPVAVDHGEYRSLQPYV